MSLEVHRILQDLFHSDPENRFEDPALGALFDPPFVGVASAADPWFDRLKDIIGPFYWTPQEALSLVAPHATARSVLCWCLPIPAVARRANRRQTRVPAREWAYVRTFGEHVNTRMRRGLEQWLRQNGYAALAPAVAEQHQRYGETPVGIATSWSERHTAFVAGLGTFGISGGLITERGKAHRLGSVVADVELQPTPRPYGGDPFAWCLRLSHGKCGACIARCPVGSVGEDIQTRDKDACRGHGGAVREHMSEVLGFSGSFGCGLCQTGVPCEFRNPLAKR